MELLVFDPQQSAVGALPAGEARQARPDRCRPPTAGDLASIVADIERLCLVGRRGRRRRKATCSPARGRPSDLVGGVRARGPRRVRRPDACAISATSTSSRTGRTRCDAGRGSTRRRARGRSTAIEHETRYRHSGRASTSQHIACLTPRTLPTQRVESHTLSVEPAPAHRVERHDYFGNTSTSSRSSRPTRIFAWSARKRRARVGSGCGASVDPEAQPAVGGRARRAWRTGAARAPSARPRFRFASPYVTLGAELAAFARESFDAERPFLAGGHRPDAPRPPRVPVRRGCHVRHDAHHPGAGGARGVCQDFAHLQIGCLRALGLPARYVSGYLLTDPPPGQPRARGRRCLARLAVGPLPGSRLGRPRPDQRRPPGPAPHRRPPGAATTAM